MSSYELAKILIDRIPESKILYVLSYLQGVVVPDEQPNTDTLEAMAEVQEMIKTDTGQHFTGSTADFLVGLLQD